MIRTRVGYAGGTTPAPTYASLGDHTESIQIDFDPEVITFEELLAIFWESHEPTIESRSQQYRNVLFFHSEQQLLAAEASSTAIGTEIGEPVATPIEELQAFHRAEDYHQKYRLRHSGIVYEELAACFQSEGEFVDSTAAARLNGYVGGHGRLEQFESERDLFGLSEAALAVVQELVETTEAKCNVE